MIKGVEQFPEINEARLTRFLFVFVIVFFVLNCTDCMNAGIFPVIHVLRCIQPFFHEGEQHNMQLYKSFSNLGNSGTSGNCFRDAVIGSSHK